MPAGAIMAVPSSRIADRSYVTAEEEDRDAMKCLVSWVGVRI